VRCPLQSCECDPISACSHCRGTCDCGPDPRDAEIERLREEIRRLIANAERQLALYENASKYHIAENARLREALEFIVTGPERDDDTFEARRSNRYRLRAAVNRARAALGETK
jgi:hypothetical protein